MGWQRVCLVVLCAYGCQIPHAAWAWFGRYPMRLCESCAGTRYGIRRQAGFTSTADLARQYAEKYEKV